MTDQELAAAIKALPGEKVTEEYIESRIASTDYLANGQTVTICSINLDNGYSVRGESACVDPANFDVEIGRTLARKDAFRKLWPLFGFLLAEQRFYDAERKKGPPNVAGRYRATALTFGEAIKELWDGQRVARAGWNGKGMYLKLQVPHGGSDMTLPYIYMRTAQGDYVPWLASQTDMLRADWEVLGDGGPV